ncbi:MAG: hypothetical protein IPM53_18420 [Anaerolineaceae bacterium]|nr:hypothetical protein [Anaerolineaceae bacterium]
MKKLPVPPTAEHQRLHAHHQHTANWKNWGSYLMGHTIFGVITAFAFIPLQKRF